MKMWVLISYREHDEELDVHGIYSSADKAEEALEKVKKHRHKETRLWEFEVDAEPVELDNGRIRD